MLAAPLSERYMFLRRNRRMAQASHRIVINPEITGLCIHFLPRITFRNHPGNLHIVLPVLLVYVDAYVYRQFREYLGRPVDVLKYQPEGRFTVMLETAYGIMSFRRAVQGNLHGVESGLLEEPDLLFVEKHPVGDDTVEIYREGHC